MKSIQLGITEIAGYRLVELIGTGGMGNVYRARHDALNREAAVKILHQQHMADRFRNEAYIQSSVSHPNIARLYEYLPLENTPCIIMEYVQGQPLDAQLRTAGKLSNEQTEHIIAQVAAALAYLHEKEIVHRDIKPSNFKVQPDGTVKMLDFGISKNKYTPKLTQLGFVVGTTEYMAPEQFHQQPEKKSDIWSLGIMTYELLTGYLPFDENNPATLRTKIIKGDYTRPSILAAGISPLLDTLIEKSLRVQAANRLTAQQAVQLFSSQQTVTVQEKQNSFFTKQNLWAAGFVLAGFILLMAFINTRQPSVGEQGISNDSVYTPVKKNLVGDEKTIKINTPSIDDASIIFPDGVHQLLPCEIAGKRGENIEFIIRANGYADKKVQVEINDRRSSYEYNLEKIKE
jgi:serine/threonine-protein kinase